jgi:hypothetical protein
LIATSRPSDSAGTIHDAATAGAYLLEKLIAGEFYRQRVVGGGLLAFSVDVVLT